MVFILNSMAWLPPAVMADRHNSSPSPTRVTVMDTRLPPVQLYRSYTRTQQRTPENMI